MSDTIATAAANDTRIDGLLQGSEWNLSLLTYGFPSSAAQYGGASYAYDHDGNPATANANEATGASQLSADMRFAISRAMTDLQSFTQMDVLRLISEPGVAQLRFAVTTTPRPNYADDPAYANFPNELKAGDSWFDPGTFDSAGIGTYAYAVGIHELGHVLGLKHGHESGGPASVTLPANWDSTEFSVMTYRRFIGASGEDWGNASIASFPQSWMMLDIRALQHMYGADLDINHGNTVYAFDDFDGEYWINGVSQGVPLANVVLRTIWDAGGNDTYDFSRYDANRQMRIDLRPGDASDPNIGWTDVDVFQDGAPAGTLSHFQAANLGGGPNAGFARGQVANAMLFNGNTLSLIENAIAGAGNDTVTGNQANNRLEGRNGDDDLHGWAGEDTLVGGAGADYLDGGAGSDMVSYAGAGVGLTVDLAFDRGNGTFGKATFGGVDSGDLFLSVEDIEGTDHADRLYGWSNQSTRILGGGGGDYIDGRGGVDLIDAGLGNDTVVAHAGDLRLSDGGLTLDPFDVLEVGGNAGVLNWATNSFAIDGLGIFQLQGFEIVRGGIGADVLTANAEDKSFYGNGGNDTLNGGAGANVLEGGANADRLFFGGGYDYADYRSDTAGVLADIRSGLLGGGHAAGDSWLDSPEGILAGAGNDSLGGNEGDNRILGRAGNDRIDGYGGIDTLDGGDGDDSIEGGFGADALYGDLGNDLIGDTEQVILLSGAEDNADDVLFGDAGNDTLLAGGGNDTLEGFTEDDYATGGAGADSLVGGAGDDVLSDHTQRPAFPGASPPVEAFVGSDADTLLGGLGADVIYASGGGDLIDGGDGLDNLIMSFANAVGRLAFTFSSTKTWTVTLAGTTTATVKGIESLASVTGTASGDSLIATASAFAVTFDGGAGTDQLRGGANDDVLIGWTGGDKIYGNGGDDLIIGGLAGDILIGGNGADTFRYDVAAEGRDRIEGFVSGEDRFWIDASGFKGRLVENMDLAATGRFTLGTAAVGTFGEFLYDQPTGRLLWDGDGSGARNPLLIATLDPGSTLAASDFLIVA